MNHNLRVPCPTCRTLMIDIEIPGSRVAHNWGCLVCSEDSLDAREHLMNECHITEEDLKLFVEALEFLDDDDEFADLDYSQEYSVDEFNNTSGEDFDVEY